MYKRICMDDSRHLNKTTSISTPIHMCKYLCMDDPIHSDEIAKVCVKTSYMNDLRYLSISNKNHIHKH